MDKRIAVLPGDGIGPEVMQQAVRVLERVAQKFTHTFSFEHGLVGGAAFDVSGRHFPEETKKLCERSDAILFGSVGGPVSEQQLPKWKGCEANSILALRKTFKFFANLRPARVYPELRGICPLKPELLQDGVDLLIVRELLGDLYFGEHKTTRGEIRKAHDVAEYDEEQIAAAAHVAFRAARVRRKKVISVDKANVLDTSKLWREVVSEIGNSYGDIELEHVLVDNCAMQLVKAPSSFDVILTTNMFGDILSDLAAVIPGSLGLTPSASLSESGFGLYEPSGGSAPDLAGKNIANPIAQILSAAMLLRFSFQLEREAHAIETAVANVLKAGARTQDIFEAGMTLLGTQELTDRILEYV